MDEPENNETASLKNKMLDLEAKISELETKISGNNYDIWLTMLTAQVNALSASLNSISTVPDINIPVPNDVGGPFVIPDGNSEHTSTGANTKTIEFQPGTGTHQNELQLVDVDGIAVSKTAVPYISLDSDGAGNLAWARTDIESGWGPSIAVETVNGKIFLQLAGWDFAPNTGTIGYVLAQNNTGQVCYLTKSDLQAFLA